MSWFSLSESEFPHLRCGHHSTCLTEWWGVNHLIGVKHGGWHIINAQPSPQLQSLSCMSHTLSDCCVLVWLSHKEISSMSWRITGRLGTPTPAPHEPLPQTWGRGLCTFAGHRCSCLSSPPSFLRRKDAVIPSSFKFLL